MVQEEGTDLNRRPDTVQQLEPIDAVRLAMWIFTCLIFMWIVVTLIFPYETRKNPADANPIMFIINTFSFQVITLAAVLVYFKKNALSFIDIFGLKSSSFPKVLLFSFLGIIVFLPLGLQLQKIIIILIRTYAGEAAPVESQMVVQILQREIPPGYKVLIGISTIIFAPVAEEILFRGLLYNAVKNSGHPLLAIYGVSLLFGIIHNNLVATIPLAFFGVILTMIYEITGNLMTPIITHALFNFLNYCMLMLGANWDILFKNLRI